jgi:phosphoglycolate phosphatase-like HAD superfamily hydrolase
MRHLVLWDIDGTLVDSGGAGRAAFGDAFAEVLGYVPRELAPMAGRTDRAIALEILRINGVADGDGRVEEFLSALARALRGREPELRGRGRALAGAAEAIAALGERDDVLQSLLTGNVEANAALKLGAFGLAGEPTPAGGNARSGIDLEIGAYGADATRRSALVGVARGRAEEKYGRPFAPGETVLVGDTPHDVLAGREAGTRVVAVATGATRAADLRAAGADVTLEDLTDTAAVVAAITGRS